MIFNGTNAAGALVMKLQRIPNRLASIAWHTTTPTGD